MAFRFLRKPQPGDARQLFPFVFRTKVTETICWDGPDSFEQYDRGWQHHVANNAVEHFFVVVDPETGQPVGSCDVRKTDREDTVDVGLWIAEGFQNKGIGTAVVAELAAYAFDRFPIARIEAEIFVGNDKSRRIFEKNGFVFVRSAPGAISKRGQRIDAWILELDRSRWKNGHARGSQ